ncbi:TrbI/VirB10 family protein [Pseudomonas meliae]|nr:TrbI/VirB10 family protein [Pseudomonas meliae]
MKVESIAMDPNLYIEENTYIPCTLQTRFVSDVAGRISCTISEDVYSANGKVKLIEKGTKAFGWYKTGTLNQGQAHMAVLFSELRTRDFKKVSLIDTQATGQLGESGISGWVDEHFWDRFKGALMLALVQTSGDVVSNNGLKKDQNTDYTANSREAIAEMSN